MKLRHVFILALFVLPALFSCRSPETDNVQIVQEINLETEINGAVDRLLSNCINTFSQARPIIVASLVSIDDIQKSSTFGRMSSEIIASRLSQHGYNVKELKMNQSQIYIRKNEGEFVLSRDLQDIATRHNVQAVVVGTYAVNKAGQRDIYVCLKIVDPTSNVIGCSQCFISKSHDVNWQ